MKRKIIKKDQIKVGLKFKDDDGDKLKILKVEKEGFKIKYASGHSVWFTFRELANYQKRYQPWKLISCPDCGKKKCPLWKKL